MNCLAILIAATLSAGNAEFEQASIDAAANIALGQLKAEIADRGLASNALEHAMLADPIPYRTRQEAERLCRKLYRDELERSFSEKAAAIVRGLGNVTKMEPPDAKLFDEAANRHFAAAFDKERKAACTAQAATIALKVKPDEADLESKNDDEARTWLTDRIASAKGVHVFEENLKYISEKIVDPILADARKERKRQQEYLMRTRSDAWAPSVLARELEANLRKNVAERKAKCDDPERAWSVFPATLKASLPTAVEKRVLALAAKDVDAVPFAPDAESVRKTISADPEAHRKAGDSEKIFHDLYVKDLTELSLRQVEEHAPVAERAEFVQYVREHAKDSDFTRAVESRVKRDTLPKWKALRNEIAKAEADRLWPTLADSTWYPETELADKTVARSDYAAALRDWRKTPELEALAGRTDKNLEETDAAADKSVASAFELARTAIAAQHEIVGQSHPLVLQAAKDLSKGFFSRKPDLAAVTEMLTQTVEKQWNEKRLAILWGDKAKPANAAEQHVQLFPSVKREIELVARQILEEVEKAKARGEDEGEGKKPEAEQKPEESKPPAETPPSPSEEKPEMEACAITFEVSGGEVTVQAKRGSNVVAERKAKATAKGFENAVREVGAIVGREIFKLK